MIGTFKTAHLIGSTKGNENSFRAAETWLTKMGYIVFAPVIYDYEAAKPHMGMLTAMCTAKLDACDFVVLVTPEHIGESTRGRIREAAGKNKPVYIIDNNGLVPYTRQQEDIHGEPLSIEKLMQMDKEKAWCLDLYAWGEIRIEDDNRLNKVPYFYYTDPSLGIEYKFNMTIDKLMLYSTGPIWTEPKLMQPSRKE